MAKIEKETTNRNKLIAQARQGDEEAIETLTLEDMDTYNAISKKIRTEDVLSLVDTYFMPYGVECDQYAVLGEILECSSEKNQMTGEEIYMMALSCNLDAGHHQLSGDLRGFLTIFRLWRLCISFACCRRFLMDSISSGEINFSVFTT